MKPLATGTASARRTIAALALMISPGCTSSSEGQDPVRVPAASTKPPSPPPASFAGRVGNPDPGGVQAQPDYQGKAENLRRRIRGRLPDPLPDRRQACVAMLDAAQAFYARESDAGHQPAVVTRLQRTRARDLKGCVAETGAAAATCTALLLHDADGEFSWLLDQCSRAFPK